MILSYIWRSCVLVICVATSSVSSSRGLPVWNDLIQSDLLAAFSYALFDINPESYYGDAHKTTLHNKVNRTI